MSDAARKHITTGTVALAVKLNTFAIVSHLPELDAFAPCCLLDSARVRLVVSLAWCWWKNAVKARRGGLQ
jgi:hypothetical protein